MVAHSRVIPYVRILIYILREVDTARRIHAERGSSQFRRYSSTRYLTPPDRHVSRTRRSHPVTTLPRAAAAVDSHFRTPAHKSKTKSAAKTRRRRHAGTGKGQRAPRARSWRGELAERICDHCFSALGAGAYSLRRGGALRGGRPRCAPDVPQMTQRSLCALGPRLPLARHRLGDHAESPPSKTT